MAPRPSPSVDPSRPGISPIFVFGMLCLPWAWMMSELAYICDDAFISFRYAENWATGNGLLYNINEPPVEGFSNPLWVALAAAVVRLGGDPPLVMTTLSVFCAPILIWRVFQRSLSLGLSLRDSTAGTALIAASPAFALWSTSGLEMMPSALMLFMAAEGLIWSRDQRGMLGGACCALALAWLRPEGLFWTSALLGLAALCGQPRRGLGFATLLIAVGCSIGVLMRYAWFDAWLPNTVVAKVGMSPEALLRGARYFAEVNLTLITPLLAVCVLPFTRPMLGSHWFSIAALATAGMAWPVLASGDFMPMGRLFVAALPFLSLVLAGFCAARGLKTVVFVAGVLMVGMLPVRDIHVVPESVRSLFNFRLPRPYFSEFEAWQNEKAQVSVLTELGQALNGVTTPDDTVVLGAIGAAGYYGNFKILDRYGLVTPEVAHRSVAPEDLTRPGHDKGVDIFYFADQRPTVLFAALMVGENPQDGAADWITTLQRRGFESEYRPVIARLEPAADGNARHLFMFRRID